MKIVVDQVKIEELKTVFELDKSIFRPMNYPIFVLRQYYDLFPQLFLVAKNKSNQLIGYAIGGISNNSGWILAVGTKQNERKKGVGNELITALITEFNKRNITEVLLTVDPNNDAVGLYRKNDFEKVDELHNYYGNKEHRVIMKKLLT